MKTKRQAVTCRQLLLGLLAWPPQPVSSRFLTHHARHILPTGVLPWYRVDHGPFICVGSEACLAKDIQPVLGGGMDGQMGWVDRQTDAKTEGRREGGRLWPRLAQKYTPNKHLLRESQEAGRKRGKGHEAGTPSMLGELSYVAANVRKKLKTRASPVPSPRAP